MRQFLNDKLDQFEEKLAIGIEGVSTGMEKEQEAWMRSKECKDMCRARGIRLDKVKKLGYWELVHLLEVAGVKSANSKFVKKINILNVNMQWI